MRVFFLFSLTGITDRQRFFCGSIALEVLRFLSILYPKVANEDCIRDKNKMYI